MTKPLIGSFQLMKSLNRSLVLTTIRNEGPISRADIAKRIALTPPTVTNIVNELLEEKFIMESEVGASSGGRKPILLRLNSRSFSIIGVDVGVNAIKSILTDLDAGVIRENRRSMPPCPDAETFLAELKASIDDLMGAAGSERPVIGIGIGMHGLVDPREGVSVFAPNLRLRNVPIRQSLEEAFGLPVYVENDVVAMALGEQWFGGGQEIDHFICVNIGVGVGAGIILNRQIFHGSSYSAGEIGHTTVDLNGPRCSCGNYGCLQTLVSGPAIAETVQNEIALGRRSKLQPSAAGSLQSITGEHVYEAAMAGDELAVEAFRKAGRLLGISLTNMIHTINPQKIILGGGVALAGPLLTEPLEETVKERALESSVLHLTIETSTLGHRATAIGAVTIVLSRLFAEPHLPKEQVAR
ncbi:ROK family transcriptional regulator [Paenibacillus hemerocallicola]|uniref:ROK family transcriptional regulator n=1 Tax=Paenibacillus hemerocallicola TaxID=1172614 RepID=A0A5C4TEA6_9BACL|nr:ROK family transcriptional regulator [Paenibacillus hemerocallicola]TNJ67444.1 ROK family transcriptional regulator [Paenibacillus hemerocallicola]